MYYYNYNIAIDILQVKIVNFIKIKKSKVSFAL